MITRKAARKIWRRLCKNRDCCERGFDWTHNLFASLTGMRLGDAFPACAWVGDGTLLIGAPAPVLHNLN